MSTISASMQNVHHHSPLAKLQKTLASEISSGKINSADESALTSALESIDSSMQSAMTSGTRPTPEEGKAKVQSLISDMVSKGTLTSEQASELQQVFDDTFTGKAKGPGGMQGPPPPPPEEESDEESSSDSVSLTLTGSSSDITELLQKLLKSLASGSSSTYSSSASANNNVNSLFLDKTA